MQKSIRIKQTTALTECDSDRELAHVEHGHHKSEEEEDDNVRGEGECQDAE